MFFFLYVRRIFKRFTFGHYINCIWNILYIFTPLSFLYILYFLGVHAPLTLNFKPPPRDISVMKRYLPFELSSKILLHPHFNVVEEHPFSNILLPFYTQKCILYKRWNIKTSSSSPVYTEKPVYDGRLFSSFILFYFL